MTVASRPRLAATTRDGGDRQATAPHQPVGPGTVVIDTSSLLNDPAVLDELGAADVVIPMTVVLELDGHKRRDDSVGHAARDVIRRLDALRARGDVRAGVPLELGGRVRVLTATGPVPDGLDRDSADHRIVAVADQLAAAGEQVSLLTDDAALRVVASVCGIDAAAHVPAVTPTGRTEPTGWTTLEVTDADIDLLWQARHDAPATGRLSDLVAAIPHPNGYALMVSPSRQVRARRRDDRLTAVADLPGACGVAPRDHVQAFALDALADADVPLVALTGAAGSGKTLLAIAAGLGALARGQVDQVTVLRPVTPVDRQELGFLPGDATEKFDPFTAAVADVIAAMPQLPLPARTRDPLKALTERGLLACMPITHLRGRTLARSFVVLDEAQNLSIRGVRTVATRIGEDGQLAVVGDPRQVDDPYLGATNNGLVRLLEAFAGQKLFAHLHLDSVQRSNLAAVAAELL